MLETTPHPRVLATIVFTDAVEFSARMGADEHRTVVNIRRDLAYIATQCAVYGGRVIKNTGDGLLMHFGSAGRAIEFALTVQTAFAKGAEHNPPEDHLQHRIGIHLGDVVISETDVLGDGVNIAARILAQAEPGGICFSQTVYEVVKNRLAIKATFLGPRELKNIRESVPLYQILVAAAANQDPGATTVLPIEQLPATGAASTRTTSGKKLPWIVVGIMGLVALLTVGVILMQKKHGATPLKAIVANEETPASATPSNPATAVQPATPAPSPAEIFELNRRAADWVFSLGGRVCIGDGPLLNSKPELPTEPFTLSAIYLAGTGITDAGLANLHGLTGVVHIDLYSTGITDSGLVYLQNCKNLKVLVLGATQISDDGLVELERLPYLAELGLLNTAVSDAGLKHLQPIFSLRLLDLFNTRVTAAGVLQLNTLPKLKVLFLGGGEVTDAVTVPLKSFTSLEQLHLDGSKVTDVGLANLKALTSLQTLTIKKTLITAKGLGAFSAAVPTCNVDHDEPMPTGAP